MYSISVSDPCGKTIVNHRFGCCQLADCVKFTDCVTSRWTVLWIKLAQCLIHTACMTRILVPAKGMPNGLRTPSLFWVNYVCILYQDHIHNVILNFRFL